MVEQSKMIVMLSNYSITMIVIGITSVGSGISESVITSLRSSSMSVKIIGFDLLPLKAGVFLADFFYRVPPITSEEPYIDRLLKIVKNEKVDIIIPGIDMDLEILSKYTEKFSQLNCKILVSSHKICNLSTDKYKLARFAEDNALPFVKTELLSNLPKKFKSPLIIKPRRGEGSRGVTLIKNPDDLNALTNSINSTTYDEYIVQTYISDSFEEEKSIHLSQKDEISVQYYVSQNGNILGRFVSKNWLKDGIPTQISPITDNNERENIFSRSDLFVNRLIEEGLRGPINMQGKVAKNGNILFFEINARYTGITDIRTKLGFREVEVGIRDFLFNAHENSLRLLLNYNNGTLTGIRCQSFFLEDTARIHNIVHSDPSAHKNDGISVFITGITGLIGEHLIEYLLPKQWIRKIVAMVRSDNSTLPRDNKLEFALGELPGKIPDLDDIDIVIHGAALRLVHENDNLFPVKDFYKVNVEGTRVLLEKAERFNVKKFVFLSTQQVYGRKGSEGSLWSETDVPNPDSIYGVTKVFAEELCKQKQQYHFKTTIIRLATVYANTSNNMSYTIINKFADSIIQSNKLKIIGSGRQKLDMIHVSDICRAVEEIMNSSTKDPQILNIGSGQPISVNSLVELFLEEAERMGLKKIKIIHEPGDDSLNLGLNITKIQEFLGWEPKKELKTAVREILNTPYNLPQ